GDQRAREETHLNVDRLDIEVLNRIGELGGRKQVIVRWMVDRLPHVARKAGFVAEIDVVAIQLGMIGERDRHGLVHPDPVVTRVVVRADRRVGARGLAYARVVRRPALRDPPQQPPPARRHPPPPARNATLPTRTWSSGSRARTGGRAPKEREPCKTWMERSP